MANYITTLKNKDNTDHYLPKTVLKAVADDNGDYLDNGLAASDINVLKNGALSSLLVVEEKTTPSFNMSANGATSGTMDVSKTGYTAIGIVGYWVSSGAVKHTESYINSSQNLVYSLWNNTSSAISDKTVRYYVLYLKNLS